MVERQIEKDAIIDNPLFSKLGVADASLWEASADDDVTVLTADAKLYTRLLADGRHVVNFNHIWYAGWAASIL
jgi:hypothetical protein